MRTPCLAPSLSWLVSIGVLVSACGSPGATTPMPEPLSLDPSQVTEPAAIVSEASYPSPTNFSGASRAAPPSAMLRVTNLDRNDPTVATTTQADGSFTLAVVVDVGNELRFQAVVNGVRLEPVDTRFEADHTLTPVLRPACIELDPGYALDLGKVAATGELGIKNACADAIIVDNPRFRLGLADFALSTTLPVTLDSGKNAALTVTFAPTATGQREDVLFVDITERGTPVRYPFTLVGGAP